MYHCRRAEIKDLPVIVEFRMEMFSSVMEQDFDVKRTADYDLSLLEDWMNQGRFAAWVAEDGDR